MKINTKVNLILIIVFIAGILISSTTLANVLERKTESEVSSKAVMLMQMIYSIRQYTNDKVHPLLLPEIETSGQFIPESIPSFSTREIFEIFRSHQDYVNFIYKDATLNPTNLRDKADGFESNIVREFRSNPNSTEKFGFRTVSGEQLFYSARPLKIQQQSCLRCHSTPEQAPKSQLAAYGSENGFNWKLNEIVATQIVYVPAEEIFKQTKYSFLIVLSVLGTIFAIIVIIINILLKKTVLQRIKNIANVAEKVSIGDMNATFGKQSKDEIGALAEAFNRMRYSLEIALNMLNNPK